MGQVTHCSISCSLSNGGLTLCPALTCWLYSSKSLSTCTDRRTVTLRHQIRTEMDLQHDPIGEEGEVRVGLDRRADLPLQRAALHA